MTSPRLVIAALRGGSGKTILSIGIIAALRQQGHIVAPFKKGPDYIDAGWLALAAGRPCYNLDTYLCKPEAVRASFFNHTTDADVTVIEGNRGLFDGIDMAGSTSTAELAKMFTAPVILCIDVTKSTRTMAAAVYGCKYFDTDVAIRGVVLNRVAGARHESVLRTSIEHHCGVPVIGAIPKLKKENFPERHMGLIPIFEHGASDASVAAALQTVIKYIDIDAVLKVAHDAPTLDRPERSPVAQSTSAPPIAATTKTAAPKIGVIRDSAFQFYYPDNLEALVQCGAELVYLSPLSEKQLPPLDALYLGGGFPETHVEKLAANAGFGRQLKTLADAGFPIYAECGGLMYLGQSLLIGGQRYPMTGVLPVTFSLSKRPRGHGYTVLKVVHENPFYPLGTTIKGHEFHYSWASEWHGSSEDLVFEMVRGTGLIDGCDGVRYKNTLALYTHIHALGTPQWAPALFDQARAWQQQHKKKGAAD